MKKKKDIVDYLKEKKQLEKQISDLRLKKPRTPIEDVSLEEMERKLGIILKLIAKY